MCERHGGPPNGSGAAKALESPVNLLSVIFGQIYFPTYSNGLKEIAGWLGFRWSDRDSSGLQSIVWTSGNKPKPRRSRTASSRIPNVSDDNQAPPRSKIQQVRRHRMDKEISVPSLPVSSVPVIHPLAKGILGSNHVWPQPSRILHL